jgi:hypothetical protein
VAACQGPDFGERFSHLGIEFLQSDLHSLSSFRGAPLGASLDYITTMRVMSEVRHHGLKLPSEVWFPGSMLRAALG